jgi:hypothetical protein
MRLGSETQRCCYVLLHCLNTQHELREFTVPPSNLAQAKTRLTSIQGVPGSNFGRITDYRDISYSFL